MLYRIETQQVITEVHYVEIEDLSELPCDFQEIPDWFGLNTDIQNYGPPELVSIRGLTTEEAELSYIEDFVAENGFQPHLSVDDITTNLG